MPEAVRIALLTHSVNPRGGVVHTLELAEALHRSGHEVTVVAPARPGQRMFRPVSCGMRLVPVGPTPPSIRAMVRERIDAFVQHLAPWAARGVCDIWHAHDGIGGNALADLAERGLIGDFVRTVHHLDRFDDPLVMQWQARSVRAARRVLCVSRLWQELLRREHGIVATEVHNGVDPLRYQPHARPDDDPLVAAALGEAAPRFAGRPMVLAIGGVEPRKNSLRLLQAFERLSHARPDARLLIVGGASLFEHAEYRLGFDEVLRSHPGLAERVHLAGTLSDAQMPALLRRAELLAMPSVSEGFGLVVLEALACGTRVVVSHIAPFTEYLGVELSRERHWVDPYDVDSIAAGLQAALAQPRAGHRSPAVQSLCERYSWQHSAGRHARIYRDLTVNACSETTHPED